METQFLQQEHGQIAFDDTGGAGQLVICLPGVGDLRAQFAPLSDALVAAGYRVVRMDFRGQGESSTVWGEYSVKAISSDLTTLIDYLNAGPAIVIGTGMGATVAAWVASETPSKVHSMVLVSPLMRDAPQTTTQRYGQKLLIKPWGPRRWANYYRSLYAGHNAPDEHIGELERNLKQRGRLYAIKRFLMVSKELGEPRLSQILAPALVLMGEQDPTFPAPRLEADALSQHFGSLIETLVVPDAGHYPHVEQAETASPQIVKFLERAQRFVQDRAVSLGSRQ